MKKHQIFLSIVYVLSIIYLSLLGYFLHRLRWYNDIAIIFMFSALIPTLIIIATFLTLAIVSYLKQNKKNKNFILINLGISSLIITSFISYRLVDWMTYRQHFTFTVSKWESADDNLRGKLIDSFRETHNIVGDSLLEVQALLGVADEINGQLHFYAIGDYHKVLAIDPFYYQVEIDEFNIVISEKIISS